MKIIEQPNSYSEILHRIFWFTCLTGVLCTLLLAYLSPTLKNLLEIFDTTASFGPIEGLKILYVIIPIGIALFSRIIKLHDRISDLLKLRFRFDTNHILFPLCLNSGVELTDERQEHIRNNRKKIMEETFYKYSSFLEPKISKQLVITAADDWGWFWVFIESSFLILVTVIINLSFFQNWNVLIITFLIFLIEVLVSLLLWSKCIKNAERQIDSILNTEQERKYLRIYFRNL